MVGGWCLLIGGPIPSGSDLGEGMSTLGREKVQIEIRIMPSVLQILQKTPTYLVSFAVVGLGSMLCSSYGRRLGDEIGLTDNLDGGTAVRVSILDSDGRRVSSMMKRAGLPANERLRSERPICT